MSAIAYALAGAAVVIAALFAWDHFLGFQAQKPADYASEGPPFDLAEVLNQRYIARGVIFDYSGRANIRFRAEIGGKMEDRHGTLSERFVYDGLDVVDTREWQVTMTGPNSFTATAGDVVGPATGVIEGNAARMTYRLRLPERAGGHVLRVVDWLYLMEDGSIVNRSEMRKFGVRAAELFATFTPLGQEGGER